MTVGWTATLWSLYQSHNAIAPLVSILIHIDQRSKLLQLQFKKCVLDGTQA